LFLVKSIHHSSLSLCVWIAVLDVPLFFISQSAVDSGLCDVVSIQRDFWDPFDHTIKIRHNFWHVVPFRARFTAYVLLIIVTVLPLDTCSRSRVFAIRMNDPDGGHESRGSGPIYTPVAHPQPVHTSFSLAYSLSSAPPRELRDLRRATARNFSPPVAFPPEQLIRRKAHFVAELISIRRHHELWISFPPPFRC
jgi:hypothetical protein